MDNCQFKSEDELSVCHTFSVIPRLNWTFHSGSNIAFQGMPESSVRNRDSYFYTRNLESKESQQKSFPVRKRIKSGPISNESNKATSSLDMPQHESRTLLEPSRSTVINDKVHKREENLRTVQSELNDATEGCESGILTDLCSSVLLTNVNETAQCQTALHIDIWKKGEAALSLDSVDHRHTGHTENDDGMVKRNSVETVVLPVQGLQIYQVRI